MTTSNVLTEYQPHVAAINVLQDKFKGCVYDVATAEGYEGAKFESKEFTRLFNQFESVRTEIKKPALELTRQIDAQAKEYTAPLKLRIDELKAMLAIEDEKQAIRQSELESQIAAIRATPLNMISQTSEVMQGAAQSILAIDANDFAEYAVAAKNAINEALSQLEPMIAQQHKIEAFESEQAVIAETLRIAQEKIDAQQAAIDAAEKAKNDENNRVLAAENERLAETARAAQAEIDRLEKLAQYERDKVEKERIAAEAQTQAEALRPESAKVAQWLQACVDSAPNVTDDGLSKMVNAIIDNFNLKIKFFN
jgi:hypothetical protein